MASPPHRSEPETADPATKPVQVHHHMAQTGSLQAPSAGVAVLVVLVATTKAFAVELSWCLAEQWRWSSVRPSCSSDRLRSCLSWSRASTVVGVVVDAGTVVDVVVAGAVVDVVVTGAVVDVVVVVVVVDGGGETKR